MFNSDSFAMVGFVQRLSITAQTADAIIVSYARKFKCEDAFCAPQIAKNNREKFFSKKLRSGACKKFTRML
ncbi:MAG: hypothetical protein IJ822_10415, partial [Pyramidobacter sp.]|nr:hypothetical protein [Pyramidobacter sp.]